LASLGIPVTFYTDSSIRQAVKSSNLVLLGCEAGYDDKFYCNMGSELAAEVANRYHVPTYICSDSLKNTDFFSIKNSFDFSGIWEKAPAKVTLKNELYEKINPKLILAVICEDGIIPPKDFLKLKFD
jgi:translation initiation factor 2B subunit (eIF-2B alpha/beta/delta family)